MEPNAFDELLVKKPLYRHKYFIAILAVIVVYGAFVTFRFYQFYQVFNGTQTEQTSWEASTEDMNASEPESNAEITTVMVDSVVAEEPPAWTIKDPLSDVPQLLTDLSDLGLGKMAAWKFQGQGRWASEGSSVNISEHYASAYPARFVLRAEGSRPNKAEQLMLELRKCDHTNKLSALTLFASATRALTETVLVHLPEADLKKIAYGQPFQNENAEARWRMFRRDNGVFVFEIQEP